MNNLLQQGFPLLNQSLPYALSYDGVHSYTSLGTMGNFGSNLGNGFYCSFQIKTTQTTVGAAYGILNTGSVTGMSLDLNMYSSTSHRIFFRDNNGNQFIPRFTFNFADGNLHTVVISVNFATQTVTITVDGNNITPSAYDSNQVLTTFSNLAFNMFLGGRNNRNNSVVNESLACTLDNFQIGTSSSVLYGSYLGSRQTGRGTTLYDVSGNVNNGTLSQSGGTSANIPAWVAGL